MTIVRLADGSLWVHSPIDPTNELVAAIKRIGVVRHVIAPNKSHHLFFSTFLQAFPDAQGWIAPGLGAKKRDLATYPELHSEVPWRDELNGFFIEGLPLIGETVWFHPSTSTLIATDLLFCVERSSAPLIRIAARALGVYERLGMSRTMKLAIRDRRQLAQSIAPMLTLPIARVVVAHDAIVDDDAADKFRTAFAWLTDS